MKISIIGIGKTKTTHFLETEAEYLKRLKKYGKINYLFKVDVKSNLPLKRESRKRESGF